MPETVPIENQFVHVEGLVIKIVTKRSHYQSFLFDIKQFDKAFFRACVKLSEYGLPKSYKVGDRLSLIVKLKPINNYVNEGGRDKRRLMRAKGIIAKGYVKRSQFISHESQGLIARLRRSMINTLSQTISDKTLLALVQSLTVAYRENIVDILWERFRQTGTSHLMAISGLHVGLIIGFVYLLVSSSWGVSAYLCQWVASQRVGALIGLIAGTCYALLAGFGLPTQRALIMACCFMLGTPFLKRSYPWHSFALSLLFVLLLNPFSIYMPGFYLSFFVVFIILSFMREQSFQWFRLQLFITGMLFPLSLYCFDYANVVSLPANLVAIPLVSFIFLPLSLIVCVLMYSLPYLAKGVVLVLSVVKSFFLSYLSILSNVHFLQIHYPIQSI